MPTGFMVLVGSILLSLPASAQVPNDLSNAIAADDVAAVKKVVDSDGSLVNGAALHAAARANAIGVAKYLVEHGSDFYARDINGQLALDVPPGEELNDTRKYLREINKKRNEFLSAVARDDMEAITKMLAEDKSLVNARDIADGWSALMMACHFGHLKVVETLLAGGASLTPTDFHTGYDVVYVCAEKGQAEPLKRVLKAGGDPKKMWRVQYGSLPMEMNALHVAAWKKQPAVFRFGW